MVKETLKISKGQKTLAHFFQKPKSVAEKEQIATVQPKPRVRPKSEFLVP